MFLVIRAGGGFFDVAEIDAAFVAEPIDVGTSGRPGYRRHRSTALVVPTTDVDDSSRFSYF